MTNSMIPYSFIPGTKAKAGEVNANFISLANTIEENRQTAANDDEEIRETLALKADSSDLKRDFVVNTTGTNLNNYKTPGSYVFSSTYKPTNIPVGNSGTLLVLGTGSRIKQIWFSDATIPDVYIRLYSGSSWSTWATNSYLKDSNPGYLKLSNGMLIQWGNNTFNNTPTNITFPISFTVTAPQIAFAPRSSADNTYAIGVIYTSRSASGFTAHGWNVSGVVSCYSSWIAVGY